MNERVAVLLLFVFLAPYSCGQQQETDQAKLTGNTYSSPHFGLSLTIPKTLTIAKWDFMKDAPSRSGRTFVLLHAWGESKIFSARTGLVLSADDLSYYPVDQRNAEAYLRKVVRFMVQDGSKVLHERIDTTVGGIKAVRADFRKGSVHQSEFVVVRKGFALVFTVTGGSETEIDDLFHSLKAKFSDAAHP